MKLLIFQSTIILFLTATIGTFISFQLKLFNIIQEDNKLINSGSKSVNIEDNVTELINYLTYNGYICQIILILTFFAYLITKYKKFSQKEICGTGLLKNFDKLYDIVLFFIIGVLVINYILYNQNILTDAELVLSLKNVGIDIKIIDFFVITFTKNNREIKNMFVISIMIISFALLLVIKSICIIIYTCKNIVRSSSLNYDNLEYDI